MSDKTDKKKIFIACGGSAGHIFPGLTLAEELVKSYGDNIEISFFTSENRLAQTILSESRFGFYTLPLHRKINKADYNKDKNSVVSGTAKFFHSIFGLFRSCFRSIRIMSEGRRPDCFIGFGSYIAGPPFTAALLLGIPRIIHEQNTVMGKANRIMRRFATKVALSFPEEVKADSKTVVTGTPVRESAARIHKKIDALDALGMYREKFTILVMGGSQGSQTINTVALETFRSMERELRRKIQVIHISGEYDYGRLENAYREFDLQYRLYPFFNEMGLVYNAVDIAVSRAGASAISELSIHKIPAILIPYRFADSHQVQNAEFLADRGAAVIIEEKSLSALSLYEAIIKLMEEEGSRKSLSKSIEAIMRPDAAKRLADEVGSISGLR